MAKVQKPAQPVKPLAASGRPIAVNNMPGPGSYDILSPTTRAKTIHGRVAEPMPFATPGPGDYDIPEKLLSQQIPGIKMSNAITTNHLISSHYKHPGPTTYFEETKHPMSIASGGGRTVTMVAKKNASVAVTAVGPGPGQYDPTYGGVDKNPGGPKVSKPPKEARHNDYQVPGAGTYEVMGKASGKALSFGYRDDGGGPGSTPGSNNVPGPGNYDAVMVKTNTKGTVIAPPPKKRGDNASPGNDAPGPGAYTIPSGVGGNNGRNTKIGEPSNSYSGKKTAQNAIGPGQYDVPSTVGTSHTHGVIMKRSDHETTSTYENGVPGPGSYDTTPKSTGHIFTMGKRIASGANHMPSPDYNVRREFDIKDGRKVAGPVLRQPYAETEPSRLKKPAPPPGPGNYDLERFGDRANTNSHSKRTLHIPHSNPMAEDSMNVPGPGTFVSEYDTIKGRMGSKKAHTFIAGRNFAPDGTGSSSAPGPGAYEPTMSKKDRDSRSILQRIVITDNFISPGPGDYETEGASQTNTAPAFGLPPGPAKESARAGALGPGTYNVPQASLAAMIPKMSGISFNGRHREYDPKATSTPRVDKPADAPGPGAYTPREPPTTCSVKLMQPVFPHDAKPHDSVAPGRYEIKSCFDEKQKGYTFGDTAMAPPGSAYPGPGAYEQKVEGTRRDVHGIRMTAPKQPNASEHAISTAPGPGAYEVHNHGPQGRQTTIQHKAVYEPTVQNPGPADYNPNLSQNTNGPKLAEPKGIPATVVASLGPGQYTPKDNMYDVLTSKSHIGIAMKGRSMLEQQSCAPDPGTYDVMKINAMGSGTKVVLLGRHEVRTDAERNPGPGPSAYDHTRLLVTKPSQPKHTMGERRDYEGGSHKSQPGPGQYDLGSGLTGKGTRIGTGV